MFAAERTERSEHNRKRNSISVRFFGKSEAPPRNRDNPAGNRDRPARDSENRNPNLFGDNPPALYALRASSSIIPN